MIKLEACIAAETFKYFAAAGGQKSCTVECDGDFFSRERKFLCCLHDDCGWAPGTDT